jgi:hypothetical protein
MRGLLLVIFHEINLAVRLNCSSATLYLDVAFSNFHVEMVSGGSPQYICKNVDGGPISLDSKLSELSFSLFSLILQRALCNATDLP